MIIDIGTGTHIGLKKEKNEDSYGVYDSKSAEIRLFKEGMFVAVADGLGGHIGGDIASKLAISMIKDALKAEPPSIDDRGSEREDDYYLGVIRDAMNLANESIYKTNVDVVKDKRPMGTTLCAGLIRPGLVYVGNVGDSRASLFRNGVYVEQTIDHSWLDEQVKQGLMTPEEAERDRRKNLLTRSIGTHPEIAVDTFQWHTQSGDQLLVCTDGLINMVSDEESISILGRNITAQEKVDILIEKALERGGKDNITVLLAVINPDKNILKRQKINAWVRSHKRLIVNAGKHTLWGFAFLLLGYLVGRWHGGCNAL